MLRAMYSGVSGLLAEEMALDVIGNNIANVNTAGFKEGTIDFADVLSQTLQGAVPPQGGTGGINPTQVGLGVTVSGITTDFTQGADQQTGKSTDLAIEGNGFFVADLGGQQLYTRNGAFNFDASGEMVTSDGAIVQGWMADATGNVNTNGALQSIVIPSGQSIPPQQSQNIILGGNLPTSPTVDASGNAVIDTSINIYDDQGTSIPLTLEFTYTTGGTPPWSVQAKDASGNAIGSAQPLTFDPTTGQLTSPTLASGGAGFTIPANDPNLDKLGTFTNDISVDLGTPGQALVNYGGNATVTAISQDGFATGTLQSVAIGKSGVITGVFSNGQSQVLGQVAVADFTNPAGLQKQGGSLYINTANSGIPQIGTASSGGRGAIASGVLEGSNVDLSKAFSDLIMAQRGFEANTKVITTSDQILSALVNMVQ